MSQSPSLELDCNTLGAYLEKHVPGFKGLIASKKFAGGQSNPTFEIVANSGRYVLRRKPPGELLKSAHAVEREFMVIRALSSTNVPVANVFHLCEDTSVIGSVFYLMEYIEGRIFWDPALPGLERRDRTQIYDEMNRVLANMHLVDIHAVGLEHFGKPGNYFERQVSRWTGQYQASQTETIEEMDQLITWLAANMPADDGRVSLVHGDYRLDNMIFHPTRNQVLAVVDWELSTLGHPFADLAYQCMQLRMPPGGHLGGLGGIGRKELGIPSEDRYVEKYCERMGISGIDNWPFYIAFSFFRLAAILQGVKKRALDGNASSTKALEMGNLVRPLAQMAVKSLQ